MTQRPTQGGGAIPVTISKIDPITGNNSLPVILRASEAHIGAVGGNSGNAPVTPTLTVAATYISGDYIGTSGVAMVFANMARVAGGSVTLLPAALLDRALQSVPMELWLFDTPVTPPADSAAWTLTDADAAHWLATLQFQTYFASAANSVCASLQNPMLVFCAAGSTSLYGCLVLRGAPASPWASGDLTVTLRGFQD